MDRMFLEISNVSKTFPGVKALQNVHFDIYPGEVHALVGENGAGKSTLIKILSGVYQPDEGALIKIDGKETVINNAIDAIKKGISVIYQDFSLFKNLTVAENIGINGMIEQDKKIVDWKAINKKAKDAYRNWPIYGKLTNNEKKVEELGSAESERVLRQSVKNLKKPHCNYVLDKRNETNNFQYILLGLDPDSEMSEIKKIMDKSNGEIRSIAKWFRLYQMGRKSGWYIPEGVFYMSFEGYIYEICWNSFVDVKGRKRASRKEEFFESFDWEKNTDVHFKKRCFRPPIIAGESKKYSEKWIAYGNKYMSAKELIIHPGEKAIIKDGAAYCCLVTQGYGKLGNYDVEMLFNPCIGKQSSDEFFVSENTAKEGVLIENFSKTEPLIMLKCFGPNHPDVLKG